MQTTQLMPTVENGEAVSQKWVATVQTYIDPSHTGTYSETFSPSIPAVGENPARLTFGTVESSWRSPKSDTSSFKDVIKSGSIKMTDYDVGSRSLTDYIIRYPRSRYYCKINGAYSLKPGPTLFDSVTHTFDLRQTYNQVATLDHLRYMYPTMPHFSAKNPEESDVHRLVTDVMGDVVSSLNSSYDPLTELGELSETLATVHKLLDSLRHPIDAFRAAASKAKSAKEIARLWLEYRYAIMPIMYSIQDGMKTYERMRETYHSEHAGQGDTVSDNQRQSGFRHTYEVLNFSVRVRAVGKKRLANSDALRLFSNLSLNPFVTAWELTKLSFVVDWALNVGNWIQGHLGDLISFDQEKRFCYSVKIDSVRDTYYHRYDDERYHLVDGPWEATPSIVIFPQTVFDRGSIQESDYLVRRNTEKSYSRRVFQPADIELSFSPSMNWRRWADALSLALGKTRSGLRV